jgi:predicted MPP superfamily phosphohydrolase
MSAKQKSHLPSISFFLLILSLFLFVANAVIYEAVAAIFAITNAYELIILGTVLGAFSASFIAATVIGMRSYNWLTRTYYTISAVWMGCFVYLFFASVIYGLIVGFSGLTLRFVGLICMTTAIIMSAYGFFHAKKIIVKELSVRLPGLPEAWIGRKALWISDLHLGQLHGPSFADKVMEKVRMLSYDIAFIGGDLYDGTGAPDAEKLIAPLKKMSAPLGIYFITGNHEEFGDSTKFLKAVRSLGIHTLTDEMTEIDGLQIIGVDYANASIRENFQKILSDLPLRADWPSILLKHEPKDLDIALEKGISLQLSGHTHRGQMWPIGGIASLVYKGFSYGLKKFKTMQIHVSSGVGTWGPPFRVGTDSEIILLTFMR